VSLLLPQTELCTLSSPARLRSQIRARRCALSRRQQRIHSTALTKRLCRTAIFRNSSRIALYLPADGEIGTDLILARILRRHKCCYLPVLRPRPQRALWFAEYRNGDRLDSNRYNIAEPRIRQRPPIPPWGLDLILLPLVAFDRAGNRLGMGGGYYDRTLAFLTIRRYWRRPKLIGLAHELQRVEGLKAQPWDVPLDGVVTEKNFYRWR
jgi:5-formyltetrahydrofolate cyclo-ligase